MQVGVSQTCCRERGATGTVPLHKLRSCASPKLMLFGLVPSTYGGNHVWEFLKLRYHCPLTFIRALPPGFEGKKGSKGGSGSSRFPGHKQPEKGTLSGHSRDTFWILSDTPWTLPRTPLCSGNSRGHPWDTLGPKAPVAGGGGESRGGEGLSLGNSEQSLQLGFKNELTTRQSLKKWHIRLFFSTVASPHHPKKPMLLWIRAFCCGEKTDKSTTNQGPTWG